MKRPARILLALSLAVLPVLVAAAGFVDQQQRLLQQKRQQWTTIDLPSEIHAPDTISTAWNSGTNGVWAVARNADIYLKNGPGFHAINLVIRLTPEDPRGAVRIGHPDSFTAYIAHGCIIATEEQLTTLFNERILDYSPRPLNNIRITTRPGKLVIRGEIKLWSWFPGFWMPLYLAGPVGLNDKGKLIFTPERIDLLGLRAQLMLSTINMPLGLLMTIESRAVELAGRRIIVDITQVFPTPRLDQAPASVAILDRGIKLCFNDRPEIQLDPAAWAGDSYIRVQAGDLVAFGKLIVNAVGVIVPLHDNATATFHLRAYKKQIAAGYMTLRDGGVFVLHLPAELPDSRQH